MQIAISSAVRPSASLEELLKFCTDCGVTALELRQRDKHGVVGVAGVSGAEARFRAEAVGLLPRQLAQHI